MTTERAESASAAAGDTACDRVIVARGGLVLKGHELPLLAGALDHVQLSRAAWPRCLDAIAELGLPLVETSAPWAAHEREPGRFDFERSEPGEPLERDLGGFLAACAERHLQVLLRVGPVVDAGLTGLGLPGRVLADERCLARGPTGRPVILPLPPRAIPLPSWASERFLEEASSWLRALARFVAPQAFPGGPLVGIALGQEIFSLRAAAYEQDYHPDAIALYRRFLAARHPAGLPAGYHGTALEIVEPPRRFAASAPGDLAPHLDWLAFRERLALSALERLAGVLREEGLDHLALYHSLAGTGSLQGPLPGIAAVESVLDLAGLHLYQRGADEASIQRASRLLAGSSRLPSLTAFGWGSCPGRFPSSVEEQQRSALLALMAGARGLIFHLTVDRDRWHGASISADGTRQGERYEALRRLVAAARACDLSLLEQRVEVALLQVRDYDRLLRCASLAEPLPSTLLSLLGLEPEDLASDETAGLEGPVAQEYGRLLRRAESALAALRLPFHIVDSEQAAESLARYRLLLLPSFDFIDDALVERLRSFVAGGGALLLTPRRPRLDRTLAPLTLELPEHTLATEQDLEPSLAALVDRLALIQSLAVCDPPQAVDLSLLGRGDRPAAAFLANRTAEERTADLSRLPGAAALEARDAFSGAPLQLEKISLGPREVRLLCLAPRPGGPS